MDIWETDGMARDDDDERDEDDGVADDDSPSGSGRRSFPKILLLVLPVLLALIGGGAWLFMSGRLDSLLGRTHAAPDAAAAAPPVVERVFYDLPEMLVNLNSPDRRGTYLRLRAALELEKVTDQPLIDDKLPLITDSFEVHLRELRVEDIAQPSAMDALRSELLISLNRRLQPVVVKDVLFKEMQIGMGG